MREGYLLVMLSIEQGMIKKYFINLEEKNYISLHDLSANYIK